MSDDADSAPSGDAAARGGSAKEEASTGEAERSGNPPAPRAGTPRANPAGADAPARPVTAGNPGRPEGTEGTDVAEDPGDRDPDTEATEDVPRRGLTPRQARRVRMAMGAVAMVTMAVVLVVRLGNGSSLLSVGLYGAAFVLSGAVIEMSRRGRTRLGMAVLVTGFVGVLAADWWLRGI
ncbi:ICP22 family protein [Streptomyces alkaliphilus]|nr:hypothetical protein [Streptomyces alkaliphilus]